MSFQATTAQQAAEENQQEQPQKKLWVTHVTAVGPYLQICGQTKPMTDLAKLLEKNVLPNCKLLYNSWSIDEKKKQLSEHKIFLVKIINPMKLGEHELLRASIIRFVETKPPHSVLLAEVEFIDMGYTKIIQCEELLIAPENDDLMTMQPLGSQYILAGIFHEWSPVELDDTFRLVANQAVTITVEMVVKGHKFIKMSWKDWDICEFLIGQRKIGSPINRDFQRDNFLRLLKAQESQNQTESSSSNFNENNNTSNKNNNNLNGSSSNNHNFNTKPSVSHSNKNHNEANALKNQLLHKERQLAAQNEQRKGQLYQQYLQHPQAFQNVMLPPQPMIRHGVPQNMGTTSMQNYMLGVRAMNRPPVTQIYSVPGLQQQQQAIYTQYHPRAIQLVTTAPTALRVQRPFAATIDNIVQHKNHSANNIAAAANANDGKTISKSLPNTGYKINKFVTGETYDVCVSFVEKGPYHFSVQLNDAQSKLSEMMNAIERVELKNLMDEPTIGMACIARYAEDNQLYRAVVVNAQPSQQQQHQNAIQVIYVDYGNSAFVKRKDLYEIPRKFLEERAFALPFSLAGLKSLGPIDDSLKKTFKEMVVYQMCKLKVTPPEGPPVVQYCELYLQQQDMLKVLQDIQKSRSVYPKEVQLSSMDIVEIRFIDSPRNFYVQKVANINDFNKLMDDMDKYYNMNQVVPLRVVVGAAYAVKNDSEWYRAEVIRSDERAIIVRFVDFGYERVVTKNLLSNISEKHLKMSRQAVHCCLKGFESNELGNKDIATTQFEMLAEESQGRRRAFTVKVFRIHIDDLHIVNLFTKELNVMKKLYKLSMPFEQYLTLEKLDFQMNGGGGYGGKGGKETTKTLSTNSDDHSSQFGKKSIKSGSDMNVKAAQFIPQNFSQQQQQQKVVVGQQQQQQQIKPQPLQTQNYQKQPQQQQQSQQQQQMLLKQQLSPKATPAQRLQQYTNKNQNHQQNNHNNNNNYKIGANEWDNHSSASSNMSKQQQQQQQQSPQTHGRKSQQQQQQQHQTDMLNNSFESTDRRSDASTNSNRSRRNNNNNRQKDRRHNNNLDTSRQSNASSRHNNYNNKKFQQQHQQPQERSQNAPQGYSQSRRGSMESLYGIPTATSSQLSLTSPTINAAAAVLLKSKQNEEYMPLEYEFPIEPLKTPKTEDITITWWVSPHEFYTNLKKRVADFNEFAHELQEFYHKKPLQQQQQLQLKIGSNVIARHRKDRTYYRARIVACNPMLRKYKVFFVDFGTPYTVSSEDIWQVEKRFADFPVMAYHCSFKNIVSNFDHLHIIDRIEKYLPTGHILSCEYKESIQNLYYVNVKVNNTSLLERLKNDKIVTEISPDFHLELLAGQQIRAKIISVKNMLNFKIIFEGCDVPLLCSYDDVRFVKSNPDYGQKFKICYEGKSCVVNIKSVNTHKVILLRPLLTLFKEDIPSMICCSPRILQTFKASLVHITDIYRIYVHNKLSEEKYNKLLDDMFAYYEKNGSSLTSFGADQICAIKSTVDQNWYRARIMRPAHKKGQSSSTPRQKNTIEVFLIDYGSTEMLAKDQLKVLESRFYMEQNAMAIEINLPIAMINDKKSGIDELYNILDGQLLTIKALECHRNHLIADIINEKGINAVDHLLKKKMIKSRDLEQMAKQLDKDNTNVLEFIEFVDLTLEDEETKSTTSSKTSSKTTNSVKKLKGNRKVEKVENVHKVEGGEKLEKEIEPKVLVEPKIQAATPLKVQQDFEIVAETPKPLETSTPIVAPQPPLKADLLLSPKVEPVFELPPQVSPNPPDYSDMEAAVFSHCDTPAQFFLHAYDKIGQLHKLQENLQIVASLLPPLMNVYNGAHCISLYSVDKQWYRAEIIDAELLVLKFIDFGNTDCLTDTTDIKEMSVFPDIEPMCILCALPIRPNGTADWVDAANAIFNESYEKTLYYTYILQSDDAKKPSYINLIIDGINVAKKLIDDGFAKPLEWVETGENCYISHVNNLSDFYIQYEKDSKALELIEFHLENFQQFPKLEKFEKNKIVAALFQDDEKWYRAQLLKQHADDAGGFEVLFIDYGNTAITHECREISTELANLPILSKKCALELDTTIYFGWSDDAESKFAEISGCGDTIFTVELKAPAADYALVHLFIDTLNINTTLEPLCLKRTPIKQKSSNESLLNASFGAQSVATIDPNDITQRHNGLIAHLNGPESFYVQFEKDSARLEDLVTALNAWVGMDIAKNSFELGKLYAAIFDDDQQLYRARLLSINEAEAEANFKVLFVDYGNEAVVKELRLLPPDLEQVREIAKHCELDDLETLMDLGPSAIQSFNDMVNGVDGVVKLEFATKEQGKTGPLKVKLYLNGNGENEENILENVKKQFTENELKENEPQPCLIPHYVTPFEFYIQLQSKISKMEKITQALSKDKVQAQMPKVAMVPALNQIYAVFAEEDDLYYRGLVTAKSATTPNAYDVQLIDYGNLIIVDELRELPLELKNEPAIAKLCQLEGVRNDETNLKITEHFATLMDAHFGESFEIEFIDVKAKPALVKLKINDEDIFVQIQKALKTGEAPQLQIEPTLYDCAIVQINDTSSFYIQLLKETSDIEAITEILLDAETDFEILKAPKVGELCAAQFPDDGVFYRARFIEIIEGEEDKTKCLVHFIDFGNDAITTEFRILPENLTKQRRFSKHCALDMKFITASEAATQHFKTYIDEHYSETFQVEFIKEINLENESNELTAVPNACRLFHQTKNVASEIERMLIEE